MTAANKDRQRTVGPARARERTRGFSASDSNSPKAKLSGSSRTHPIGRHRDQIRASGLRLRASGR
jgi:hypothetical protein